MLTGPCTGSAADTPLRVVVDLGYADDTEVSQMRLVAVVGASGNIDLDVVVAGEDDGLNLTGQLIGIDIGADTVMVADTAGDIPGADGRITAFRPPCPCLPCRAPRPPL